MAADYVEGGPIARDPRIVESPVQEDPYQNLVKIEIWGGGLAVEFYADDT